MLNIYSFLILSQYARVFQKKKKKSISYVNEPACPASALYQFQN